MRLVDFLKLHEAPPELIIAARIARGYFYDKLNRPEFAKFRHKFLMLENDLKCRGKTIRSLKITDAK